MGVKCLYACNIFIYFVPQHFGHNFSLFINKEKSHTHAAQSKSLSGQGKRTLRLRKESESWSSGPLASTTYTVFLPAPASGLGLDQKVIVNAAVHKKAVQPRRHSVEGSSRTDGRRRRDVRGVLFGRSIHYRRKRYFKTPHTTERKGRRNQPEGRGSKQLNNKLEP